MGGGYPPHIVKWTRARKGSEILGDSCERLCIVRCLGLPKVSYSGVGDMSTPYIAQGGLMYSGRVRPGSLIWM